MYTLSEFPSSGKVILLGRSPMPVYYFRKEVVVGGTTMQHCELDSPFTTDDRLAYIARLGGQSARTLLLKASYRDTVTHASDDIQIASAKLRSEIESDFYTVVELLLDQGALVASEVSGLRPQINLTVLDDR